MIDSVYIFILCVLAAFIVGFLCGHIVGTLSELKKWKQRLVDNGLAEYNKHTGEWESTKVVDLRNN